MTKNDILEIIYASVNDLAEETHLESLKNPSPETLLYGARSGLDSIQLVTLIADIEERLSREKEIHVVLANEHAMSQRLSPFRSIGRLAEYIESLII